MVTALSHIIADIFIRRKVITEERREAYEYGFELGISALIEIIITLTIGLLSRMFWESVMFYIVFSFTRLFTGGFHATKRFLDKILFAAILMIVLIVDRLLQQIEGYYWFVLHFYSLVIVCEFAPIKASDQKLLQRETVRLKVISILIMAVWLAVMFLFRHLNSELDHIVALSLFCVSNLMLLKKYYDRRKME